MSQSNRLSENWEENAESWTRVVRDGGIEGRLVTDQTLLSVLEELGLRSVLDLRCGEGWLVRRLAAAGVETLGIDASEALVRTTERFGDGSYRHLSFAALAENPQSLGGLFDCIVANFALLEEDVGALLYASRELLASQGGFGDPDPAPLDASGSLCRGLVRGTFRGLPVGRMAVYALVLP